jgi:hypothetical protein
VRGRVQPGVLRAWQPQPLQRAVTTHPPARLPWSVLAGVLALQGLVPGAWEC